MRISAEQRRRTEQQIRTAADALLRGELPPDGKCDVSTLARRAGVSRAALYRTYPHLKEEFERRLAALQAGGNSPDPRDAQISRLKTINNDLKQKLTSRDAALRDLERFKALAISRLAAQHEEISRLRQAIPANSGNLRSITRRPTAIPGSTSTTDGQETT